MKLDDQQVQPLELKDQFKNVLEECRMVLPGMQALFGFQLVAVFNAPFAKELTRNEQASHLVATCLTTIAIALVMPPASLHRQTEPHQVSKGLLDRSSNLMTLGMLPLALGIVIDLYLITRVILNEAGAALAIGISFLAFLLSMWFLYPRLCRLPRSQTRSAGSPKGVSER